MIPGPFQLAPSVNQASNPVITFLFYHPIQTFVYPHCPDSLSTSSLRTLFLEPQMALSIAFDPFNAVLALLGILVVLFLAILKNRQTHGNRDGCNHCHPTCRCAGDLLVRHHHDQHGRSTQSGHHEQQTRAISRLGGRYVVKLVPDLEILILIDFSRNASTPRTRRSSRNSATPHPQEALTFGSIQRLSSGSPSK